MRAVLRSLELTPEPRSLPGDPADFAFLARMMVGPADGHGEESFDLMVCSPEWLARSARSEVGGIYHPRHHLVVNVADFDQRALRAWLSARVDQVEGSTWAEIGERLGRLAHWEFEDYRA